MFPTPHEVTVHPVVSDPDDRDAHGKPKITWGSDRKAPVIGWAPAGSLEPNAVDRNSITWDLDLLVPHYFTCDPRDEITVASDRFTIEGALQDFTKGPWWPESGKVLRLSRTEG